MLQFGWSSITRNVFRHCYCHRSATLFVCKYSNTKVLQNHEFGLTCTGIADAELHRPEADTKGLSFVVNLQQDPGAKLHGPEAMFGDEDCRRAAAQSNERLSFCPDGNILGVSSSLIILIVTENNKCSPKADLSKKAFSIEGMLDRAPCTGK